MKIIDLLNKIANGEDVPKIVQTNDGDIFYYDETDDNELMRYKNIYDIPIIDEFYLNEEVEILEEEKKIPEKLDEELASSDDMLYKINEIIDYLDYLKSKGE